MNKERIIRKIDDIKEKMEASDADDCYLGFDEDYQRRLLDNKLTPEEKEFNDWIDGLSPEEFAKTVQGWLDEWEAGCKARKKKRLKRIGD